MQEASSPRKNCRTFSVLAVQYKVLSSIYSEALCITTTICSPHGAMDLDDFDAAIEQLPPETQPSLSAQSPRDAVAYVDAQWYTLVNRRGRWMDLIGDYAGSEPFVVDGECMSVGIASRRYVLSCPTGEALIQLVLDDPLLALGRKGGT